MFIDFFYELRRQGVPATTHEWEILMQGLEKGLHGSSLDGFYKLARSLVVRNETDLDAFDQAFIAYFKGVYQESLGISEELLSWLNDPKMKKQLTDEERERLQSLDLDELRRQFEERLKEQKERHDGGNKWIGTGGTSPFGHGGTHPSGLRIGGPGGGRSAMQIAEERRFKNYRSDRVLDVRQMDVALRKLRRLGREGAEEELDLDETIDQIGKNAGDIDLVFRPERRNRMKLILLMDVGGSMDPFAELVERMFTAASRAGRFSKFRYYYFHNCIYDEVFEDAEFREPVKLHTLFDKSDKDERVVIVGDALMHPGELLSPYGHIQWNVQNPKTGHTYLKELADFYRHTAWLNPEPKNYWRHNTIEVIAEVFPMFELTLEGLSDAVTHLVR